MVLIVLVLVGLEFFLFCEGKQSRLLLNDPDAMNARLEMLEKQNQKLTQTVEQMNRELTSLKASVATGFAAGQKFDHGGVNGGPANILCLPRDPDLSNTTLRASYSSVFGSEYETNLFRPDSANNDTPCAVCLTISTTALLMVPGRRSCYNGWTKEYSGLLASGSIDQPASSYICIDDSPEYLQSGERNDNGRLFYPVRTQCGSLPCPPYHNNVRVECVVCSK